MLSASLGLPSLAQLAFEFLSEQDAIGVAESPTVGAALRNIVVSVHHSAVATFYAPTDPSGIGGMRREVIRAMPSWRGKDRRDTIFINHDPDLPGMRGLLLARVRMFLHLQTPNAQAFPCALVHWWEVIGDTCDEDTGMWVAEPQFIGADCKPLLQFIHLDTILRGSHLTPVHSADPEHWVPRRHDHTKTLDTWQKYYINKFVDLNAYAIAF
jgi:hypothetical protein